MAVSVSTTVTELPESRVRVQAEVPPEEVEKRLQQAARALGRDLRIPGFRTGKVPPPVIIQRLGRAAVLDEAVRESLGLWYTAAIEESGIHPVGDPDVDLGDLPESGGPLSFTIEIGVRPTAKLGDYKGLEVGRRDPEPSEELIDGEVEALRERMARLETADRAGGKGDYVVMDYLGTVDGDPFAGGEGRDQLLELGSGRFIPGFEDQLQGLSAGQASEVKVTFPEDYRATELAGKDASFAVTVKEVKERVLPELDEDFAVNNGFDTIEELRADIRERLAQSEAEQVERDFRQTVLDAVVANATIDVPEALVDARAHELWHEMTHSLGHQGISKELFLQMSGKTEEEIVAEAKPDARTALERDAALAAVIEAEGIHVSDEDVLESVIPDEEERARVKKPQKLLARLREAGRLEPVREDLAARRALDVLVESATPISVEQARAKNLLWTPEKERESGAGGRLWTPGNA